MATTKRSVASVDPVGVSYEQTRAGKPPIAIHVAPRPSSALQMHPSLRPSCSPDPHSVRRSRGPLWKDDGRRDSGRGTTSSGKRESRATTGADVESLTSSGQGRHSSAQISRSRSSPPPPVLRMAASESQLKNVAHKRNVYQAPQMRKALDSRKFSDLSSFTLEDLSSGTLEFSKRGSLMVGEKRAGSGNVGKSATRDKPPETDSSQPTQSPQATTRSVSTSSLLISNVLTPPMVTALSTEDDTQSQRVRSMYQGQLEVAVALQTCAQRHSGANNTIGGVNPPGQSSNVPEHSFPEDRNTSWIHDLSQSRREKFELAGGLEDWQDVRSEDVDRYGFIVPKCFVSPNDSSTPSSINPELRRTSTQLQLASTTPRRQKSRIGRSSSNTGSTRSDHGSPRFGQRQRAVSSQASYRTATSTSSSRLRSAMNKLPQNRDRRFLDEAGDMLTPPPGLADIAEQEADGRYLDVARLKEIERNAKWQKMARPVQTGNRNGEGMTFDFDTYSPKVISRTWKGIPDRWRATAWWAFLAASARRTPGSPIDAELFEAFTRLLDQSSPDDLQIDIDVPRTISSHIMFRRRYRGGQRLLFRVLHCLSLYFPETGYVQGMAALAATFLCYFEEEKAFVMLVRMWQLRGLDRLYQSGFEGLMEALDEFEGKWLAGGSVGVNLKELGISPTAYGTRWYLTIFNYSIPFPAQLRVWDIFLLLGDADKVSPRLQSTMSPNGPDQSFHGTLDILHATSAALIDGTRDILLGSDFECAMKCLTSWIPIRDEDLLIKVAKAEWNVHRKKR